MPKISNKQARNYVKDKVEFDGSNIFARIRKTDHSELYVVFSYGFHFPMYVAETMDGKTFWYRNTDTASPTTTRHQSQCDPYVVPMLPLDTEAIMTVAHYGLAGLAAGMDDDLSWIGHKHQLSHYGNRNKGMPQGHSNMSPQFECMSKESFGNG